MRTIAIVQARMGSTRLPGKVMLDLAGRPVIERVVERLHRIPELDQIVVATSTLDEEAPLLKHLAELPVGVYRGSPTDVLGRYAGAARAAQADIVVRITADCPLICPSVSGQVIRRFVEVHPPVDYVSNTIERSYPRGLDTEVFSAQALFRSDAQATAIPDREHVTPYIWRHPEQFKLAQVSDSVDRSHMRWTLDTPEDYEFLRRIYESIGPTGFEFADVLQLLSSHPDWPALNSHIRQKRYGE